MQAACDTAGRTARAASKRGQCLTSEKVHLDPDDKSVVLTGGIDGMYLQHMTNRCPDVMRSCFMGSMTASTKCVNIDTSHYRNIWHSIAYAVGVCPTSRWLRLEHGEVPGMLPARTAEQSAGMCA